MAVVTLDHIEDVAGAALQRCGATALQADPTARSVRDAEAEGIRNVGLGYLPVYGAHLLCGKVIGTAVPNCGGRARWCDPASRRPLRFRPSGVRSCPRRVRTTCANIGTRAAHHQPIVFGRRTRLDGRSRRSTRTRRHRLRQLVTTRRAVGRTHGPSGHQPVGVRRARDRTEPLVFDMATSATAYVNILQAAQRTATFRSVGRSMPPGSRPRIHNWPSMAPSRRSEVPWFWSRSAGRDLRRRAERFELGRGQLVIR